jgi:hypothetical protein
MRRSDDKVGKGKDKKVIKKDEKIKDEEDEKEM